MPGPRGWDFQQSHNSQAAVDRGHQVMVAEAIGIVGTVPREVSAAAADYSARAVEELRILGVDQFIGSEKTRHGRVLEPARRARIPKGLSFRDRTRRKLRTKRD